MPRLNCLRFFLLVFTACLFLVPLKYGLLFGNRPVSFSPKSADVQNDTICTQLPGLTRSLMKLPSFPCVSSLNRTNDTVIESRKSWNSAALVPRYYSWKDSVNLTASTVLDGRCPTEDACHWLRNLPQAEWAFRRQPVWSGRVAVCLAGGARTFFNVKTALQESLVVPRNADVFLHVFDNNRDKRRYTSIPWVKAVTIETFGPRIKDDIWKFYGRNWFNNTVLKLNSLSMFRKVALCMKSIADYERDHGFAYEYIVRSRPDLVFDQPIDPFLCARGDICIGDGPYGEISVCPAVTDMFAIGTNVEMKLYGAAFYLLGNITSAVCDWPEHFLYSSLTLMGLQWRFAESPNWSSRRLVRSLWAKYQP
eukprot:TRINITY_DN2212_c0_g1_i2.p1 TRINITY_DN2212_c0_g1~~TRINITY_DN2212_c0_g1_i2.p1  ORF type:complete len:365 (-),score=5.61 TRINITY_DN2212_c0_g1_i2:245-1339(-)